MRVFRGVSGIGLMCWLMSGVFGQAMAQTGHDQKAHARTAGHHHHKHAASHAQSHAAHDRAAGTRQGHDHVKSAHRKAHSAADGHPAHRPRHAASRHAAAAAAAGAAAGGAAAPSAQTNDAPPQPPSEDAAPQDKGTNTGLPLPRFAAMRADKVYMRKGPGQRYPIEWVYHRRGLPVEVEREFDVWRLIEDSDGTKGWVHQATLVGQRTFVIPGLPPEGAQAHPGEASAQSGDVIGRADARVVGYLTSEDQARGRKGDVLLLSQADENSGVVAVLQPGTVGTLKLCPQGSTWCRVVVKGYTGWLPRRLLWGLLPGETIQPS